MTNVLLTIVSQDWMPVICDENCHAFPSQIFYRLSQFPYHTTRQAEAGLVEEQDAWFSYKSSGKGKHLLFSPAQISRGCTETFQKDLRKEPPAILDRLHPRYPEIVCHNPEIVLNVEGGEYLPPLGYETHT